MRVEQMLEATDPARIRYWNRLLHDLDPNLGLVFAKPNAFGPGIRPGYWHVRRRNEKGADSYFVIQGRNGEYREMDDAFLQQLREGDFQNTQVLRANDQLAGRRERSAERAKETAREARADEIAINVKAQVNPSIAFTDRRWSNRPAGKRGRRAA